METAGFLAWRYIASLGHPSQKIVFLAGSGNNGGDALVCARHALLDGFSHLVILSCGSHISESCAIQRSICAKLEIPIIEVQEPLQPSVLSYLEQADIIVDGLAGTGLGGPLRGIPGALVQTVNALIPRQHPIPIVVALDVPSGCGDTVPAQSPVLKAAHTVVMGQEQMSLHHPFFRQHTGKIVCVNPGFPPAILAQAPARAHLLETDDFSLPRLGADAYKKTRGHLALFAGSREYRGAPLLASMAAFHARIGLVSLFTDSVLIPSFIQENPSLIVHPLDHFKDPAVLDGYGAILAGPGWGQAEDRPAVLRMLLEYSGGLVLDAGGIRLFASMTMTDAHVLHHSASLIMTPHPGELQVLYDASPEAVPGKSLLESGPEEFLAILEKLSIYYHATIIAKSHVTWIVSPEKGCFAVDGMNPSLGVAGSGDVMAGMCAAFLGQGCTPLQAACNAVLVHRKAGEIAREELGWYAAHELIAYVGTALAALQDKGEDIQ